MNLNTAAAAQVGSALLGLWLLTKSLPGVVENFLSLSLQETTIRDMASYAQMDLGVYLFEVVFALFLMLKSHVFAQLVLKSTGIRDV